MRRSKVVGARVLGRPRSGLANGEVMRRRATRRLGLVALVAAAACTTENPQNTFDPRGPYAREIKALADPVFAIAVVVGILVLTAVVVITIRYRRRPATADMVPHQLHGNTTLEIAWTIAPAVLLLGIGVFTYQTIWKLEKVAPEAMRVNVIGQQWWWEYEYPDTGVVTASELVIPVGKPVYLDITSRDVIHSFWVPKLNGKKDARPGATSHLSLHADEPGTFMGQCAEFCGLSHADMRLTVKALPQREFDAWMANQLKDAVTPKSEMAKAGLEVVQQRCLTCHRIEGVGGPKAGKVPKTALLSGAAPNLTHLQSRDVFAGAIFPMDRVHLRQWVRDPTAVKPMAPENLQGMPNLGLTEDQIDQVVAYLETLK